ncbi:baculoviral IAP repeat-containing protein 3-like [Mizuhopecten yessoensis]|uniref:baculoviral IAP repeat-containing protein 3-like n=1 Tax=Mizuhopecten yessoensis TaxID=6573 RepID=UPI000B45B8AF|nr:baculoviral IAP repeat-containing protein 3-like [Mizuhopecten yessoensis]
MNRDTHHPPGISAFKSMNFYQFKHQLISSKKPQVKGGSQNARQDQGSTKFRAQMIKIGDTKLDHAHGTREHALNQTKSSLSFTLNKSAKNVSVVLTNDSIEQNDSGDENRSLLPHCKNTYPTVLLRQHEGGNDVYVGQIDIQDIHLDGDVTETDENDDKGGISKGEYNKYELDIETTLHIDKNQPSASIGRSCHPIRTDRYSHERVKCTRRQKPAGITNKEVLQEFFQATVDNFEEKGCFKQPPELIRQHVLYPQKKEYSMPPLTPVPIYPNDKNEQININPFFPLLNTYRQWPNDLPVSPSALARAGFHSVTTNDQRVGCRSCGIELHIDDFNGNDPYTVHRQRSSTCPALDREGCNSTVIQQATTPSLNVNNTEIDDVALQRLQLTTDSLSNANGTHQIETINERHTHPNERSNIHTDSIQGASASASPGSSASAAPHQVITYSPRNSSQVSSESRRQSFRNWPGSDQDIDALVQAGFFFTGEEDIVRCFHCDIGLAEWDPSDDPWVEHARHSPDCPFLRSQRDDHFISNIQRRWSQIYTPKHPHMSQTSTRLESYDSSWPRDYVIQQPEHLAEAGFFYTGETDTVRCHYCDGGLREWEPNDDPWTEHARWFPFCKFVIKVKGLSFIQAAALEEDNDRELDNSTGVATPYTRAEPSFEERCRKREQENPMLSAAVESVKEFGYKKKMIKNAILVHIETSGKREFSESDLMEIIFKLEEKESSLEADGIDSESCSSSDEISLTPKALAMENEYLKTQQRCELCRIRDRCMLFVPCGHRITCEPCGKSQTSCSVCSQEVTSCVKTFLG